MHVTGDTEESKVFAATSGAHCVEQCNVIDYGYNIIECSHIDAVGVLRAQSWGGSYPGQCEVTFTLGKVEG